MIYEPAEDSYLIEKEVRARANGKRVLDMGAGSGILARAALEAGAQEVVCIDIDTDVVSHLKDEGFTVVQSDLFSRVTGEWDVIVFNPPYLPHDEREDSESARVTSGGEKGDEIIIRFLTEAKRHLAEDGVIVLLVSSLTPMSRIENVLRKEGFVKEVIAREKMFMEELSVWEIKRSLKVL